MSPLYLRYSAKVITDSTVALNKTFCPEGLDYWTTDCSSREDQVNWAVPTQVGIVNKRSRGNIDLAGTRVPIEIRDFGEQRVWEPKDQNRL